MTPTSGTKTAKSVPVCVSNTHFRPLNQRRLAYQSLSEGGASTSEAVGVPIALSSRAAPDQHAGMVLATGIYRHGRRLGRERARRNPAQASPNRRAKDANGVPDQGCCLERASKNSP